MLELNHIHKIIIQDNQQYTSLHFNLKIDDGQFVSVVENGSGLPSVLGIITVLLLVAA